MRPRCSDSSCDQTALTEAVAACQAQGSILEAIQTVYADVDRAVEEMGASCAACGECCGFLRAGHRLYVSTAEVALLSALPPPAGGELPPLRCPYQVGPRCLARALRPLGCRAFFCPRALPDQEPSLYEKYHRRLRQLHQEHFIPYLYVEMTGALAVLSGHLRTGDISVDRNPPPP
jgi:Fe-S-cluster containining protein